VSAPAVTAAKAEAAVASVPVTNDPLPMRVLI
jgi:hypothetical protein